MFYDPPMELLDIFKVFSPLHSQMQSELGSTNMCFTVANDLSNGHSGVQLQYGSNEPEASEFLDSILCNPDETLRNMVSVKDNESCSGSDAEGVNARVSGTFQDIVSLLVLQVLHHSLGSVDLQLEFHE